MSKRNRKRPISSTLPCATALALIASCSGGGGGGSQSFADVATLESIRFPLQVDASTPPTAAPLNQQVVFTFNDNPNPDEISTQTIQIQETGSGFPVPGEYTVEGNVVTFTPALPTREFVQLDPTTFDVADAGLQPGKSYSVRIGSGTWDFIGAIGEELATRFGDPLDEDGVELFFGTTTDRAEFLTGLPARSPRVLSSTPSDGASGVTPQLYTDPDGVFPPRAPFVLELDAPVNPAAANLDKLLLVDMDDVSTGNPAGLPLGIDVAVLENRVDRSTLEITPSGILPFGHQLSLEVPADLRGISEPDDSAGDTVVVATFTTAAGPDDILDVLAEDFDTDERQESDADAIDPGKTLARWDDLDSNVLEAGFAFDGIGELGRFVPPPPEEPSEPRVVVLDTSSQNFPLLDGSTPDAPPGTVIAGGEFSFSEIDIPEGVILSVRGPNPLILSCTGSVRIAGAIELFGFDGKDDNAFDSSITSLPGGASRSGGGRGGEGHPILFTGLAPTSTNLVSPPFGGRGFGPSNLQRIGGTGGQSGMLDREDENGEYTTDRDIECSELTDDHNNGWHPPGGGGGSMLTSGTEPLKDGRGNVLADGLGNYIVREKGNRGWRDLDRGSPGVQPFRDSDADNDFLGPRGEQTELFGGQGGGAGGSGLDGYFCGDWCKFDASSSNDGVCEGEFGIPGSFSGSVGDTRGGSGGAGGGALMIRALGDILLTGKADIDARGGNGGGGEALGCGNWGGCGAGGSGGAIVLQSAVGITIRRNGKLRVDGGLGKFSVNSRAYITSCGARSENNPGSAGHGGVGIIQLQVPPGEVADVVDETSSLTAGAWVDRDNLLNPSEFNSVSVAQSSWYDMGRTIDRGPPSTNPIYSFRGTDLATGLVRTDLEGNVLDAELNDIRCDFLGQLDPLNPGQYLEGQEPRSDYIPTNATVQVLFQGGDAVVEGSKEVDTSDLSEWVSDVTELNGRQFIRYRIVFDIAAAGGTELGPTTPRPGVQSFRIQTEF